VQRFMSNVEYALLLDSVPMIKMNLKVMHSEILRFCLLFAVSCVTFTLFSVAS